MRLKLVRILVMVILVGLVGCTTSLPPTISPTATTIPVLPTATLPPLAQTPVSVSASPEAKPLATASPVSVPTATAPPPTEPPTTESDSISPETMLIAAATSLSKAALLTATSFPATDTVCAAGCDFTTIQAAIDDPGTPDGAVIEVTDSIHTEAGIVVNKNVTIQGLEANTTIVQAHDTLDKAPERVFLIEKGATVVLRNVTIRHGKPGTQGESGGGVMNYGTLTIEKCVVTNNTANGGAGICNSGVLTVTNSTVSGNTAHADAPRGEECGSGAGIKSGGKTLALINSTVSDNQTASKTLGRNRGGGVHIGCACTAVFINSTISNNRAVAEGGGVYVAGTLQLVNSTISDNGATGRGGGVYILGKLSFVNTIIAGNGGRGGDCVIGGPDSSGKKGSIGVNANNLVGDSTCNPDYSGDPMLGPLANNGGPSTDSGQATWTHALLPGSPAIDVIPVISCTLPIDQRGAPRPAVQTSPDTPCDIGAFEVEQQ